MTTTRARMGLVLAIALGVLSVVGLLYVHVWSANPTDPGHDGKSAHTHDADVVMGSRVFIGDSRTSMGFLYNTESGKSVYGASGCDRDRDGNDVAVQVVKYNGETLRERDTNGPGDNGCAYIQITVQQEPASHQLLEFRGDSNTVIRNSPLSCHNPASRYC
jgi:hypothetical protein